jgi:hypothetical protein
MVPAAMIWLCLVSASVAAGTPGASAAGSRARSGGPAGQPYSCRPGVDFNIYGTFGDASVIGWAGDQDGVVACLGGSFYVRDGQDTTYGFGVYNDSTTTWVNADGYLPALITRFRRSGVDIAITNFGDRVVVGRLPYVLVYSRVEVHNRTGKTLSVDPQPSRGLTPLTSTPDAVRPGGTVDHDYVVTADRFGGTYPLPSSAALAAAGGFRKHFHHMSRFWNDQLRHIAELRLPDRSLSDAYRAGYIDTQIIRDGNRLNTGENGYDAEFSHDVIGILANLFTQGDFQNAHALLTRARHVVGDQAQYVDGLWTYSWPWAIYLMKTGDRRFVKENFTTEGPLGAREPSIKDTAHLIAADRKGPGGIMEETDDIDTNGFWTIDNYEALMGLAAYRYVAQQLGDSAEVEWATTQYRSLLAATNATLKGTIARDRLDYLPCSMLQSNMDNRCANAEDANWAAPFLFGRWAWDGYLFGAERSGPGYQLIDATYRYGFARLIGKLPANTFGGYPSDFWSTAYNAGYGSWGLAGSAYRSQGILSYQWMIANDQSGPYAWWESASNPNPASPWLGVHPASGQGSAPHAWGMANANKVLLDSLAAQRADGQLIVGRGVPDAWVRNGQVIAVDNFPTRDGQRISLHIATTGDHVTLHITGGGLSGPAIFQLPAFVGNISSASTGSVDEASGTVTIQPSSRVVSVTLRHPV